MKKIILINLLLISICAFAQVPQGFNYQSVIRNASGDLLVNTSVGIQLDIRQTSTTGTIIYTESHNVTTNGYGLVTLVVGQGTSTDDFTLINWTSDSFFIEVSIDTNGGMSYTSLGTSQILSVPYALAAGNVSGLEALDEGNGTGWRIIGRDPLNYDDIGVFAIDFSYFDLPSTTNGASGILSTAFGYNTSASNSLSVAMGSQTEASGSTSFAAGSNTVASGNISTAIGSGTVASGFGSFATGTDTTASEANSIAMGQNTRASNFNTVAMGFNTTASGAQSVAMGNNTIASGFGSTSTGFYTNAIGNFSTSFGFYTDADSYLSTVIGRYNIGGGDALSWINTDAIFEIGNGTTDTNKANAFTVYKNGDATLAGTLTQSSDKRLKKNIQPLTASLDKIKQLNGKHYYWNDIKPHSDKLQIGLIAQEVEKIFPELVHTDSQGYKSVDYTSLIPVLIEALKEQEERLSKQDERLSKIEALLKK